MFKSLDQVLHVVGSVAPRTESPKANKIYTIHIQQSGAQTRDTDSSNILIRSVVVVLQCNIQTRYNDI